MSEPACLRGRTPRHIAAGVMIFRLGLLACPRSFRRCFGSEMRDVFLQASLRARLDGGTTRLLGFWLIAFVNLFATAFAERRDQTDKGPTRRQRGHDMFDDLTRDLRLGARSLLHSPAFTLVVVLSLAIGIGANVAIYSLVGAVFLRPVPLREPERLVAPGTSIVTYPAYRDFRDRLRSFAGLAAWDTRGRRLVVSRGDDISVVPGVLVSGNYFSVFGVEPHVGRAILPADDEADGGNPVAVIGYNLWRRGFGADPSVVGERISVNGYPLTIIGVAPPGFRGERLGDVKEMWIPLAMHPLMTPGGETDLDNRDAWWIRMMGRLDVGVTAEQALAELNAVGASLAEEYPRTDGEWQFEELLPAQMIASISRREDLARFMWMLAATVGAALLIACANVSNLLLLRSEQRRAEIDMRRALGATRWRLFRQLLTESAVLALLGGAAGVIVAIGALGALRRFELPGSIEIAALEIGVRPSMLALTLAISLLTALLFGVLPALQGVRGLAPGSSRGAPRTVGAWARGSFTALQVALSLALLAGGGLFARSLVNAVMDVGFDAGDVLIADVNLDGRLDGARAATFFDEVAEQLGALPGVRSVSWSNAVPVERRGYVEDVIVGDYAPDAGDAVQSIHMNMVSSSFFETIGVPLLQGRVAGDEPALREVVVNQALVDRYWPGGEAIGKRLQLGGAGSFEVVGVAADTTLRQLGEDPFPYIFAPLLFAGGVGSPRLALRLDPDAELGAAALRRVVQRVDESVPVTDLRGWSAHVGPQTETQQLGATLLGFFSFVSLTLASVGIYGVISFGVARRRRELGIRAALGAERQDLIRLTLAGGAMPLLIGTAVGVLLALAAGRSIAGFLFAVEPYDVATLAAAAATMLTVGLIAAWLPARRVTQIDPRSALNAE